MPDLTPGTTVRFTRGPLGAVNPDYPTRFLDRTVGAGDTGTIAETTPGVDGWLYVDIGDGAYVPEHENALEIVEEGAQPA